jgi:hypothetical protein
LPLAPEPEVIAIQLSLVLAVHAYIELTVTAPVPPLRPTAFAAGAIEFTVPVAADELVTLKIHTTPNARIKLEIFVAITTSIFFVL